jgi:hypothetical protein
MLSETRIETHNLMQRGERKNKFSSYLLIYPSSHSLLSPTTRGMGNQLCAIFGTCAPTQTIFLLSFPLCARISSCRDAIFWSLRHCALAIQPIKIQKWLIIFSSPSLLLLLSARVNFVVVGREKSTSRSARFAGLSNFV